MKISNWTLGFYKFSKSHDIIPNRWGIYRFWINLDADTFVKEAKEMLKDEKYVIDKDVIQYGPDSGNEYVTLVRHITGRWNLHHTTVWPSEYLVYDEQEITVFTDKEFPRYFIED